MAKMVCVGIRKTALLLLSLSLLSDRGEGVLPNRDELRSIMTTMFNSFNQQKLRQEIAAKNNKKMATGQQYSIALQLSSQECQKGVLNNFPTDLQNLRNTLSVCLGLHSTPLL
ncbi:hypothetical protein GJAV_G00247810 [Gymnothorax javanicus]|nr:hypothetical protein GJAV_G00247810 [Gymnothorax javanicus]